MSEDPKVSYVLPTHNRVEWVAESIQGLLQQTVKEVEVIVVDDASDDGSLELLEWFVSRDPRVKLIVNQKNMGAGESRTIGHKAARAPIIGVTDSDDFSSTDRTEKILNWFKENPQSELVNFGYVAVGYNNEVLEEFPGLPFDEKLFKDTGGIVHFSNPTVAVKRESVLQVPYRKEQDGKTDDYQFVEDWIKAGKKIDFCPEIIVGHRTLPSSIMAAKRGFRPEWAVKR